MPSPGSYGLAPLRLRSSPQPYRLIKCALWIFPAGMLVANDDQSLGD